MADTSEVLPAFDSDLSPKSERNRDAAERRGWRYDPVRRAYLDEDGALMADRFGQPY